MDRKLAAILFSDIAGFTQFTAGDEEKAVDLINHQRELFQPIVSEFDGDWLKEIGDGLLLSFTSSKKAINCAIKLQEKANYLTARWQGEWQNHDISENPQSFNQIKL